MAKLDDLRLVDGAGNPLEWAETLVVTTDAPLKVPNVDDDLARETLMYEFANSEPPCTRDSCLLPHSNTMNHLCSYAQALESVHKALALCEKHGVKHQRPEDYYAEMLKTDDHMLKLKDHLLAEKRRKEERTKTIKERQMKKFAKKVRSKCSPGVPIC